MKTTTEMARIALTVDEINILRYFLQNSIDEIKSGYTGGAHARDEKMLVYAMMTIDKKLTAFIQTRSTK